MELRLHNISQEKRSPGCLRAKGIVLWTLFGGFIFNFTRCSFTKLGRSFHLSSCTPMESLRKGRWEWLVPANQEFIWITKSDYAISPALYQSIVHNFVYSCTLLHVGRYDTQVGSADEDSGWGSHLHRTISWGSRQRDFGDVSARVVPRQFRFHYVDMCIFCISCTYGIFSFNRFFSFDSLT